MSARLMYRVQQMQGSRARHNATLCIAQVYLMLQCDHIINCGRQSDQAAIRRDLNPERAKKT